ncbi:NUDIX domain-containing protein [bacterium JGI 053]|nr:NUDIX domain-containing protein [bacterium JGI 053]
MRDGAIEVLLITRRGRSGWIIPKGKVDRKLGPGESARREAAEEAGVEGEVAAAAFDEYRHGGGDDDPLVHVFLLCVTRELPTWPEADERERKWVWAQQASTHVADPGLARVLSSAAAYLATNRAAAPAVAPPVVPECAPPPKRGAFTPLRLGLGLLLLGVVALAAFALASGRRDGTDARSAIRTEAASGAKKHGRDGNAAAAPAASDSTCRVEEAPVALPNHLSEASGIAAGLRSPGVLWSHNDSGQPLLYAFAPDGSALGVVRVAGARMENWEDVAAAPCAGGSCLYVADIGDNAAARASLTVYRVPEPAPTDGETRPAEAFHATYPEGPQDAEALFVLPDGGIYIVTKGETGPIALYRFPQPLRPGASVRLERIVELGPIATKRKDRITGASASPDGRWVALRTLEAVDLYRAADLIRGVPGTPVRVDLRSLGEAQGEGVGWGPSGTLYLTSESGKKNKPGTLARLSCTLGA